jgi:hypothetical protein
MATRATNGSDPGQLLGRARAGNNAALGRLLELHRNYLNLLARLQIGRRLQGKVDGSDLVQEVKRAASGNEQLMARRGQVERPGTSLRSLCSR